MLAEKKRLKGRVAERDICVAKIVSAYAGMVVFPLVSVGIYAAAITCAAVFGSAFWAMVPAFAGVVALVGLGFAAYSLTKKWLKVAAGNRKKLNEFEKPLQSLLQY